MSAVEIERLEDLVEDFDVPCDRLKCSSPADYIVRVTPHGCASDNTHWFICEDCKDDLELGFDCCWCFGRGSLFTEGRL